MYQIGELVVILPTYDTDKCSIGHITKAITQRVVTRNEISEVEVYTINGARYTDGCILGVGEEITVKTESGAEFTHTLTSIATTDISLKDYTLIFDNKIKVKPENIVYDDSLDVSYVYRFYDDNGNDIDSEEPIDGYKDGYIDAIADVLDYLGEDVYGDGCSTIIQVLKNDFDTRWLSDLKCRGASLNTFYDAVMSIKKNKKDIIPQYTHEELVELIGHDFELKES